jgi:hypothetical protein
MGRNSGLKFELTKRIEGITRSMNRVTYEAVASMVVRMDEVSPVGNPSIWEDQAKAVQRVKAGYIGGQFRGNWQLGINARPTGWIEGKIDPTGVSTVAENLAKIPLAASRGYTFHLVNNVPYARALENGHSSQMPRHMISRIRAEFPQMVNRIVQQVKSEGGRVR